MRPNVLELIKNAKDERADLLAFLSKTEKSIYIYGAGNYANQLKKSLSGYGVSVSRMVVDGEIELLSRDSVIICGFMPSDVCVEKARGYGFSDVLRLGCLVFPIQFIDYDYVLSNLEKFSWLYERLDDDLSRSVLVDYLNHRISGSVEDLRFVRPQYFNKDVIDIGADETYADVGAYDGDSLGGFIRAVEGCYRKIYAFEPGEAFDILKKRFSDCSGVEVHKVGAWSGRDVLRFSIDGDNHMLDRISISGEKTIDVAPLDDFLLDSGVSYIKMDIEGAELPALRGLSRTISKYRPKLAIAVYHKREDLIEIPAFISELNPEYRFRIRFHSPLPADCVLYAF